MTRTEHRTDRRNVAENDLRAASRALHNEEHELRAGGGADAVARQHAKARWTARERIAALRDPDSGWLEFGLWAGYRLYDEWGGAPARGLSR